MNEEEQRAVNALSTKVARLEGELEEMHNRLSISTYKYGLLAAYIGMPPEHTNLKILQFARERKAAFEALRNFQPNIPCPPTSTPTNDTPSAPSENSKSEA